MNNMLERLKVRRKTSPGVTFILLGVLAAVGAAFAAMMFLQSVVPSVPVLVAGKDLRPGMTLTRDVLAVKKYPKTALPSDRAMLADVEGRHLRVPLAAGDPLRRSHIAELVGSSGTVAARLANDYPDRQGVPLPSSVTEGLPWIEVGDRLSLLCTITTQGADGQNRLTRYIVWDAPVVWSSYVESLSSREDAPRDTGTVVVALTPSDAEVVQLALSVGTVKATVNPAGVELSGPPSGVAADVLRGNPAPPVQQAQQPQQTAKS